MSTYLNIKIIITPHRNSQLISDKDAKVIQWKKNSLFNNWCWYNSTSTKKIKKKKQNPRQRSYTCHGNWLKMDYRPKYQIYKYKTSRRKHKRKTNRT